MVQTFKLNFELMLKGLEICTKLVSNNKIEGIVIKPYNTILIDNNKTPLKMLKINIFKIKILYLFQKYSLFKTKNKLIL